MKKLLKSKIFRILEPLVDFIFNFKVYNFGLKTFKKALSPYTFFWESFLKIFSPNLKILKLNIKSRSGSKILKIWIWEAFFNIFSGKNIKFIYLREKQKPNSGRLSVLQYEPIKWPMSLSIFLVKFQNPPKFLKCTSKWGEIAHWMDLLSYKFL